MKTIPSNLIEWYEIRTGNHIYVIASKPLRDKYIIYELINGSYEKLGMGANPLDLEKQYVKYSTQKGKKARK